MRSEKVMAANRKSRVQSACACAPSDVSCPTGAYCFPFCSVCATTSDASSAPFACEIECPVGLYAEGGVYLGVACESVAGAGCLLGEAARSERVYTKSARSRIQPCRSQCWLWCRKRMQRSQWRSRRQVWNVLPTRVVHSQVTKW